MSLASVVKNFWVEAIGQVCPLGQDQLFSDALKDKKPNFKTITTSRCVLWNNALGAYLQKKLDRCEKIQWAPGFLLTGPVYSIAGKYEQVQHTFLEATVVNVKKNTSSQVYLDVAAMQFNIMDVLSVGCPLYVVKPKNNMKYVVDSPSERMFIIKRIATFEVLYDKKLEKRLPVSDPFSYMLTQSLDQMLVSNRPVLALIRALCPDWLADYPERFKGVLLF